MIRIRFSDRESKCKAVAFLLGRCSFKSLKTGVLLVPEPALGMLAGEGIPFAVEGPASYADQIPQIRDLAAAEV